MRAALILCLLILFVPALAVYLAVRSYTSDHKHGEKNHRATAAPISLSPTDEPASASGLTNPVPAPDAFYIGKGDQRVRIDYGTPDPVLRSLLQSVMEGGSEPGAKGREIFLRLCAACHQPDGEGRDGLAPPLVGSEWALTPRGERMIRIVLNGIAGPVRVRDKDWNLSMPPWRENLNDDQVAVVLTYVRTQLGSNHATAITPEAVAAARKESSTAPESAAQLLRIRDE